MAKFHRRAAAAVVTSVALAGCGQSEMDDDPSASAGSADTAAAVAVPARPVDPPAGGGSVGHEPSAPPPVQVLSGCERYADPEQAALVAEQPVLEVIAGDPDLSWLQSALTGGESGEVDYRDVLVGGPFTVFAPVDAAVDTASEEQFREDPVLLRFQLDYHVVPGQALAPQELVDAAVSSNTGTVPTLQGWGLGAYAPLDGSAELALSEDSVVPLCGGIVTADATLYLVPAMMHPPGDYVVPGAG